MRRFTPNELDALFELLRADDEAHAAAERKAKQTARRRTGGRPRKG